MISNLKKMLMLLLIAKWFSVDNHVNIIGKNISKHEVTVKSNQ